MNQNLLACLIVAGPFAFGGAMAALAFWIFDLAAARNAPREFAKQVRWVLLWMVGNGSIALGSTYLATLSAALEGITWGVAAVALSYMFGFGVVILLLFFGRSHDRSLLGQLRRHLNDRQIETILQLYRYNVTDPRDAASNMGVNVDELQQLHMDALRILRRRANSLFADLGGKSHGPPPS